MSNIVKYDKNIAVLSKIGEILENEKKIKELDYNTTEKLEQLNTKSILIHDLKSVCDNAMLAYRHFEFPKFSPRNRENRLFDKERRYFFENGIRSFAGEIVEVMKGIEKFDGYTGFENYIDLYKKILTSPDDIESLSYLKQLVILARHVVTSIPNFEETKLIVPSISSTSRTQFA